MHEERSGRSFEDRTMAVYRRKWSQDFTREMTRSVEQWVREFAGE